MPLADPHRPAHGIHTKADAYTDGHAGRREATKALLCVWLVRGEL